MRDEDGTTLTIPWGAWYAEPERLRLEFPADWDVHAFPIAGAPGLPAAEIEAAVADPIGTPPLEELARGKRTAAIVVEDISRPSDLRVPCEAVVRALEAGGIARDGITVIGALGAHRPMTRADYVKKIGQPLVDALAVVNHHPYENLVSLGASAAGTPIFLNRTYHAADLKVAVGTVLPHPLAGFGGGAKIVLPGICGIETLAGNHQAAQRGVGIGLGIVTEMRRDVEDVCARVGLDFSVNLTTNARRQITGAFAGDFIAAHRAAMARARAVYRVALPRLARREKFDVGLFNLYPEDTELSQAIKGLNLFLNTQSLFARQAAQVFMTAATEGRGYHSLSGETGARLYQNWGDNPVVGALLGRKPLGIFSPHVSRADVHHFYPRDVIFERTFPALVAALARVVGPAPKVAVFPTSLGLADLVKS